MICERCGTQFEGRNCPRCDAPAEKIPYRPERTLSAKPFIILSGVMLSLFLAAAITLVAFVLRQPRSADIPAAENDTAAEDAGISTVSKPDRLDEPATETQAAFAADASLTDSEAALQWKQKSGVYADGDYAVGTDIPTGEYIILSDGVGYGDFCTGVYASPSMSDASEIWFEWQQWSAYVVLEEGQYLHFSHATLYDPEIVDITLDPFTGSGGMFKCGRDIEPGTYRLIPTDDQYGAEYTVYSALTSSGGIVSFSGYVDGSTPGAEFPLREGEYISLRFARLEPAE